MESTIVTASEQQPGIRGDTPEIVQLDIRADIGFFVLEFADQNLDDTDPSGDDTVPGAERTVVVPMRPEKSATAVRTFVARSTAPV